MNRGEYEQLDAVEKRSWVWYIVALVTLPAFIYVFVVLPVSAPDQIELSPLRKFERVATDGRVIMIGDVHGCYDQLQELLKETEYTEGDTVVLLGDLLSKGPGSLKVATWARENNISAVLGNHELNILSKYQSFRPLKFDDHDVFALKKHNGRFDEELQIARKLKPEDVQYLNSLPLVMQIDGVGICTHMGILESSPIKKQSISDILAIDRAWYKRWNELQKTLPKRERESIYYGHHAALGLNLHKYSKGLDTGCVYGGQLSALVIDNGAETLYQVQC